MGKKISMWSMPRKLVTTRRMTWMLSRLGCAVTLGCEPMGASDEPPSGSFTVLTYNVAGLPQGLNDDQFPEIHIPQISPKLNAYDLVLAQEDFSYTAELRAELVHPYRSYPLENYERFMGDGLNRFSQLAFPPALTRVRWNACFGLTDASSDCLANKGFSVARHVLAEGIELTVVNLHAEAGGGPEDVAARAEGFQQLRDYLSTHHEGEALLIAGDTNLHDDDPDDATILAGFLASTGTVDACTALGCGEAHIDRFFYRSGTNLTLYADDFGQAVEMVDAAGNPLSDHPALHLAFFWTARSP